MKKFVSLLCAGALVFGSAMLVQAADATGTTPIAYYSFDDALGTDSLGGNNLETVLNGEGSASSVAGVKGKALSLNGGAALAAVNGANSLDFTDGLTNFSMSFYAKNESATDRNQRILSSGFYGDSAGMFTAYSNTTYEGAKMTQAFFGIGGMDWWGECYRGNIQKDEAGTDYDHSWKHFTITYDATKKMTYMYIDGELFKEAVTLNKLNMSNPDFRFAVGGVVRSTPAADAEFLVDEGFIGAIDELRIYNTLLSAEQVKALYNDNSSQATAGSDAVPKTGSRGTAAVCLALILGSITFAAKMKGFR